MLKPAALVRTATKLLYKYYENVTVDATGFVTGGKLHSLPALWHSEDCESSANGDITVVPKCEVEAHRCDNM